MGPGSVLVGRPTLAIAAESLMTAIWPEHFNMARTYDPATGRYLEADPVGLRGGWNLYRYASNRPTEPPRVLRRPV